jgi:hypothetical protein
LQVIAASEFWEPLVVIERPDVRVEALWLRVLDTVPAKLLLRFEATGSWTCLGHGLSVSGPDGLATLRLHVDCLLVPTAPPGALIGKIGGSSAGRDDGKAFAIGSFCVYPALEKPAPLFIAVNGAFPATGYAIGQLRLTVSGSDQSQDGG